MSNSTTAQTIANIIDLPAPVKSLLSKRGTFVSLKWSRPVKTRKGHDVGTIKETVATVRIGCEFENLAAVQDRREAGEEKGEMAWGNWLVYPIIKEHKGSFYVRGTMVKGNDNCKPKVRFLRQGEEVSREQALEFALASETKTSDEAAEQLVFDVKVDNILEVNGVAI